MIFHCKAIFFIFKSLFARKLRLVSRPLGGEDFLGGDSYAFRQAFDDSIRMIKSSRKISTPVHRYRDNSGFFIVKEVVLLAKLRQKIDKYIDMFSLRFILIPDDTFLDSSIGSGDIYLIEIQGSELFLIVFTKIGRREGYALLIFSIDEDIPKDS